MVRAGLAAAISLGSARSAAITWPPASVCPHGTAEASMPMNGRTVGYRSVSAARHSASPSSPSAGPCGKTSATASTAAARSSLDTTRSTADITSGSETASRSPGSVPSTTDHAAAIRAAAVRSLGSVLSFSLSPCRAAPDSSLVDISRSNSSSASSTAGGLQLPHSRRQRRDPPRPLQVPDLRRLGMHLRRRPAQPASPALPPTGQPRPCPAPARTTPGPAPRPSPIPTASPPACASTPAPRSSCRPARPGCRAVPAACAPGRLRRSPR